MIDQDHALWFLYGLLFTTLVIGPVAYRVVTIARAQVKLREAEVMDREAALAQERAIPKKRPRSTPHWPKSERGSL